MDQVAISDMMLDSILDIHSLHLPSGKRHLERGRLFAWENENGQFQCQRVRQGTDGNADSNQIDASLD